MSLRIPEGSNTGALQKSDKPTCLQKISDLHPITKSILVGLISSVVLGIIFGPLAFAVSFFTVFSASAFCFAILRQKQVGSAKAPLLPLQGKPKLTRAQILELSINDPIAFAEFRKQQDQARDLARAKAFETRQLVNQSMARLALIKL